MKIPGQRQESMIKAQEKTQNQGQDHRDLQNQQSLIRLDRTIDRPLADDLIFRTYKKPIGCCLIHHHLLCPEYQNKVLVLCLYVFFSILLETIEKRHKS
jgi:hypothetical protein